ncbi:MAG: transcription elongation factor GreA [Actinomycetes bacterium]|jgi:transcription elongation factor GreA|nr:transcription elongation factor GreA [Acidimicrobiia bacterium]
MTDETTWLTPEAYEKLTKELEYLKTEGRAEIEARIAEARSHGDLRENADYDAAKNDQGMLEARIRQLEDLLRRAEVREATHDGTVQIGSVVTVVDDDGDEVRYFVATPENKVPGLALASPDGPLGSALLGAKVGDRVTYEAPGGTFSVEVKAIEPYRE